MPRTKAQRLMKHVDRAASFAACLAFDAIQFFNKYKPNPSFTPKWSEKPLLKSWQKSKPPLGWPRTTDSLCPKCVIEARKRILDGEGVPGARPVRRHDGCGQKIPGAHRGNVSGAGYRRSQRQDAAQPWF